MRRNGDDQWRNWGETRQMIELKRDVGISWRRKKGGRMKEGGGEKKRGMAR